MQRDYGFARPPEETAFWSSHLTSFLTADPQNWFWARPTAPLRTGRYISERNLFPGLLALALAVVGAITSRRRPLTAYFALLALGSAVLALGPRLYLTDDRSRALFKPLPYAMLYRYVPGIDAMRSPGRFGVLFGLSAAVLAGLGLQWLLGRMLRLRALGVPTRARVLAALLAMALVGGIGLESLNRPYTLQSLATGESIPPVYRWLAAQPATVIVELPFLVPNGSREVVVNNRFQYFSLYHRHPALNGSADIVPKGYTALAEELLYGPTPRALAILQGLGTTHIVVHYDLVREFFGPRIEGLTRTALETPGLVSAAATFGSDVVYRLAPGEQFAQLRAIVPREATVYLSREDPLGTYGGMLGWVLQENRIYTRVRVHFGQVYAGRPAPGTPYDYGVLYAQEDPVGAGFDRAEVVWQDNVVRVYRRLPP